MSKSILVVLAALALSGCMKSYPLWDPPPPQPDPAQPQTVTVEGTVMAVDEDDESFELETLVEGSEEVMRVELGSSTEVFPAGARDRAVSGSEGIEMLAEDDTVVVSGLTMDDDVVRAREVEIQKRTESPRITAAPAVPRFQPTERVSGIVRAVDAQAGRIVLEGGGYGVLAFFGDADTPVFYRGKIYKTSNLEVGDDVTVTIGSTDGGDPASPWITKIDVNRSVSAEGVATPAAVSVPEPPRPDVTLDALEIDGTIKRIETQGFEIEAESGALRYITADLLMPVASTRVERVSNLKTGMKLRVRCLAVGDRLVAQKISLIE